MFLVHGQRYKAKTLQGNASVRTIPERGCCTSPLASAFGLHNHQTWVASRLLDRETLREREKKKVNSCTGSHARSHTSLSDLLGEFSKKKKCFIVEQLKIQTRQKKNQKVTVVIHPRRYHALHTAYLNTNSATRPISQRHRAA